MTPINDKVPNPIILRKERRGGVINFHQENNNIGTSTIQHDFSRNIN
jgi:hypothetical protein